MTATLLDLAVDEPTHLEPGDVDGCMDLLDARGRWLHDTMGITDQWPRSMRDAPGGPGGRTFDRAGELRRAADAWNLHGIRDVAGQVVACAVVNERADPDYRDHYPPTGVDAETGIAHAEPRTFYVHRIATAPDCAGYGLGARLLGYAGRVARERGGVLLRLECSRSPRAARLRRFYVEQGFTQVGDVAVPGRYTGALFQRTVDEAGLRLHTQPCRVPPGAVGSGHVLPRWAV